MQTVDEIFPPGNIHIDYQDYKYFIYTKIDFECWYMSNDNGIFVRGICSFFSPELCVNLISKHQFPVFPPLIQDIGNGVPVTNSFRCAGKIKILIPVD